MVTLVDEFADTVNEEKHLWLELPEPDKDREISNVLRDASFSPTTGEWYGMNIVNQQLQPTALELQIHNSVVFLHFVDCSSHPVAEEKPPLQI